MYPHWTGEGWVHIALPGKSAGAQQTHTKCEGGGWGIPLNALCSATPEGKKNKQTKNKPHATSEHNSTKKKLG